MYALLVLAVLLSRAAGQCNDVGGAQKKTVLPAGGSNPPQQVTDANGVAKPDEFSYTSIMNNAADSILYKCAAASANTVLKVTVRGAADDVYALWVAKGAANCDAATNKNKPTNPRSEGQKGG